MEVRPLIIGLTLVILSLDCAASDQKRSTNSELGGKTLRITTILIEPYMMARQNSRNATGNDRYYGFMADLLAELSGYLGFTYEIVEVPDNTYGYKQSDGTWNGMIGQVMRKEVDIAAGPLYITEHRKEVVSFTGPFLRVQATVLLRKPSLGNQLRIKTISDLINQSEIIYGTLKKGIIMRAFQRTNNTVAKIIYRNMQRFKPSVFTSSNEEGIQRVRNEKYAFILPDTIGEYISLQQPCDLTHLETFLMQKEYGLALHKNSKIYAQINRGVRFLRRKNRLDQLRLKWWQGSSTCNGLKSSQMYRVSMATKLNPGLNGNTVKIMALNMLSCGIIGVFTSRSMYAMNKLL